MKCLPLSGFQPLFAYLLLIAFLFGCRKDNFSPTDNFPQTGNPSSSANLPITVNEAMAYFGGLHLHSSASLHENDTTSFDFVPIGPVWERAFVGHSQSGREIVVVPLPDNLLSSHNQGRAGAKLLFSKLSGDTISARVLIYLADTAYYRANNQALDFNTFTGLYIFFDIGLHFVNGIRMKDGVLVGKVKSIYRQGNPDTQARNEDCDCITHFDIMLRCQAFAFGDCDEYANTVVESEECTCGGGGGGGSGGGSGGGGGGNGGSGGSTGGGGGGNGSGNGGNNNGCSIPSPTNPLCFYSIFTGQVPVEIFVQNGGTLPEGFNVELFEQYVDIYNYYHSAQQSLTLQQLQWIANHPDAVPLIWGALFGEQAGEEASMARSVLNLAANNNLDLSAEQFEFLMNNQAIVQTIYTFLTQHWNNNTAVQVVAGFLFQIPNLAGLTLDDLNYVLDNFEGIKVASTPPNNDPVSVADPICAQILNFSTRTDDFTNLQYAGMILHNSYFQFDVPGSTPVQLQTYNMRITAYANANSSCLASCPAFAANAINIAVLQTQQVMNGLPSGTPNEDVISSAKFSLLRGINREFNKQVSNCNSAYTTDVIYRAGMFDNWDNLPIVDCDAEIVNCP